MFNFKDLIANLLDFIYPRTCFICARNIEDKKHSSKYLCLKCFNSIPLAPDPSKILFDLREKYNPNEFAISNAISLFKSNEEAPIIRLIYNLKYSGFFTIGEELGTILGELMKKNNFTNYDFIIPSPIHKARRRERGYNQAFYIAKGVAKVINVEISEKIIKKPKYTVSQTKLGAKDRKKNVEKAFIPYSPNINIHDKKILLVDDVLTTGATLNSCAGVLLDMGAIKVDIATLIKA